MKHYQKAVKEEAQKIFGKCAQKFRKDTGEHGGKSERPNLSLWLDRKGILASHLQKLAEKWTRGDVAWINENTRHRVTYGDPRDNAFAAFYKDILSELKKLMKGS